MCNCFVKYSLKMIVVPVCNRYIIHVSREA
jgi:hypothetical protein